MMDEANAMALNGGGVDGNGAKLSKKEKRKLKQ